MVLNSLELEMHFTKNNRKFNWGSWNKFAGSAAKLLTSLQCLWPLLHHHTTANAASVLLPAISTYSTPILRSQLKFPLLWKGGPLEEERANHASILARIIPWAEEPGGLQSMGLQRDWAEHSTVACLEHLMRIMILMQPLWVSGKQHLE